MAACIYGLLSERLFSQPMAVWLEDGVDRFLWYTALYWAAARVILWRRPAYLLRIAAAFVVLYTAWWAGAMAPLAVLYFLGSCYCLGRLLGEVSQSEPRPQGAVLAVLLGAAAWMFLLWCALHFPINTPWTYGIAFAVPYLAYAWRHLTEGGGGVQIVDTYAYEKPALAVLLFVLLAHWLAALAPDISTDGLAVHLNLPAAVARDARWTFDFHNTLWALMPSGGDVLYTAVYLLGGEFAAHMLNFAFLGMIAVLISQAAQRWTSSTYAYLATALFLTTPAVQLVTGSLFVENIWAALLLGAVLALLHYVESDAVRSLIAAAALCGAAMAVKHGAIAFAAPIGIAAAVYAVRKKHWRAGLAAAAVGALLAAPPYAYSYARTGNPIFPFLNTVFRSPEFYANVDFTANRYADFRLSWETPYDFTFRTHKYIEGQDGASGFQYFLLLAPALWFTRRRDQILLLAIAMSGMILVFLSTPYLRYLYTGLPLLTLAIAWLTARVKPRAAFAAILALCMLNLWFLPAAGWYHKDFTIFRKDQIEPYLTVWSPVRLLIARLNREYAGEAVAFFSTQATAQLLGPAYTDSWHSEHYWQPVRDSPDPEAIVRIYSSLGIRHIIAPTSRHADFPVVRKFLTEWLEPDGAPVGALGLYRLRDAPLSPPRDTRPLSGGSYDDDDPRIEFAGKWFHDSQFPQTANQSLTYSDVPGDLARFRFSGSAVTLIYTRAVNRGIAEVWIDGKLVRELDLYSSGTQWQASATMGGLAAKTHLLELKVSGRKHAGSQGLFVDLDAVRVAP